MFLEGSRTSVQLSGFTLALQARNTRASRTKLSSSRRGASCSFKTPSSRRDRAPSQHATAFKRARCKDQDALLDVPRRPRGAGSCRARSPRWGRTLSSPVAHKYYTPDEPASAPARMFKRGCRHAAADRLRCAADAVTSCKSEPFWPGFHRRGNHSTKPH